MGIRWRRGSISHFAELLKPSTLSETHWAQWYNAEGNSNWGLGFVVMNRGGTMIVGHGGSCPGYRSVVLLDTKTGIGVAVFINSAGGSPEKFADGIFKVLNNYASTPAAFMAATPARNLSDYANAYDVDVEWGSETAVLRIPTVNYM